MIKFYAWEAFYAHRISELRAKEIAKIRRIAYVVAYKSIIFTF